MVWIQVPPVGDGLALEDDQEGVCDSEEGGDTHDEADDPDVNFDNRDAQQKQSNGNLENRCRYGVEHFAEEPVPKRDFGVLICEILAALTCSMEGSADLACEITSEEQ